MIGLTKRFFVCAMLASMSVSTCRAAALHGAEQRKPNIVILYADDLGYGDLGCYNAKSKIPTPHLDQLAREGMRFTDAHSSSGICTPSRYALLTGRHHWRDFHDIVNAFGKSVFKPDQLTLPKMLQSKGYTTAAIGKWHLGWEWDAIRKPAAKPQVEGRNQIWEPEAFDWTKPIPDGPLAHGFDHYFGDTVINFPPYCWIEDDKVVKAPDTLMDTAKWKVIKEGIWECRPGPMLTGWDPYQNIPETTRRGIQYIHAQKGSAKPFFLYFAYPSPHAPIIPNDQFDGKSDAGPYGDFVVETDDSIGQLLKALKDSGQADNTIVIFSADNGPEHYAYARDEKFGHWSSHPLRGLKRDIYEGGHRVPTIIKWPGVTKAGSVSEALVSQIDFMATLAAALDYKLPDNAAEDSHNLLPLLKGEVDAVRATHVHNTYSNKYAIRHGDWVLIDAKDGYVSRRNAVWETRHGYTSADTSPLELYNLKTDLAQKHNVAAENPERVAELQVLLKKIREQGYSAPRLANFSAATQPATPPDKPNILLVIVDDLGYGDLGCYGQQTSRTPVLDKLAAQGLRFTQHYSGSTVCAPSRSALMTGLDTGSTWLRGNGVFELRPDPADLTIATLLKRAGYRTAMVGKSCVTGNTQNPQRVLDKGFDIFYGTTSHKDGHHRYPRFIYDQTQRVELAGNALHTGDSYDAELYTARAERFIRESDAPFFLLLSYPIPHAAVLGPEGSVPGGAGMEPGKAHYTPVKEPAAHYRAMVETLDSYVGRLLGALEKKGVARNTLLLFTSDNGSHFEGGYNPQMLNSSGPLRGGKRDLYEGGIRVPLIAHWPAGITRPGTSDHVSAFWDFLPTACALAGVAAPAGLNGISYLPTLAGTGEQRAHNFLYWEFHEKDTRRALRQGAWKLVQYDLAKKGKPMLFHLARDIAETNDLADHEPERVAAMLKLMHGYRKPSPIFPNPALDSMND